MSYKILIEYLQLEVSETTLRNSQKNADIIDAKPSKNPRLQNVHGRVG